MKHELFEQWKDANLMEMECSCLPVNLKNQKVTTLRGKFGLQVRKRKTISKECELVKTMRNFLQSCMPIVQKCVYIKSL